MTQHYPILLPFLILHCFTIVSVKLVSQDFDPTGTYKLDNETYVKHGKTYGQSGNIRVKLISSDSIVVHLYKCIGAPSNRDGNLIDTLLYQHHQALYHHSEDDTSCRITFYFTNKGVSVVQVQKDPNMPCGFGFGVFADGDFKKISSKVPDIEDE